MRILDLFCGCGGFALGFILASPQFKISLALDNDFRAIHTYSSNIEVGITINRDIQTIHSLEILKMLDGKTPDVILASPPCESFSTANPNRENTAYNQLYADERGRLVLEAIRLITDLEPTFFIIENVSQLGSVEMQELLHHEFSRSSYSSIYFNTLEAVNSEVPSYRRRTFISNVQIVFPKNSRIRTVKDAFKSLPEPNTLIYNHEEVQIPRSMMKKIPRTPPGGALVYFRGSQKKTYRNYIRLKIDQPSPTVMGKSRFIHPFEHRLCTVREHARLMSYPDSFQFFGSNNWQYNQVGESVPPQMSKMIALQILNMSRGVAN